jgi:protoheme IX farnesyltransferase
VLAESVLYSWLMVAASLALWHWAGPVYEAAAAAAGGVFLYEVHRLYRAARRDDTDEERLATMRLFHLSLLYLTLLFAAVAAGALIR